MYNPVAYVTELYTYPKIAIFEIKIIEIYFELGKLKREFLWLFIW
jgi:hypothetical protein